MYVVDPIKCYLLGGGAVIVSVTSHFRKKSRLKFWIPTVGSVQNVRTASNGDSTVYVRFTDQAGKPQTAAMLVADGDSIGLGSELEISYDPKKPDEAFVRSEKDMNLAFYIPLVAGLVLLGMGVWSTIMLSQLEIQ